MYSTDLAQYRLGLQTYPATFMYLRSILRSTAHARWKVDAAASPFGLRYPRWGRRNCSQAIVTPVLLDGSIVHSYILSLILAQKKRLRYAVVCPDLLFCWCILTYNLLSGLVGRIVLLVCPDLQPAFGSCRQDCSVGVSWPATCFRVL